MEESELLIEQLRVIEKEIRQCQCKNAIERCNLIKKFTYDKRENEDKEFCYFGVFQTYSKGVDQKDLAYSPIAGQKIKKLLDLNINCFIEFSTHQTIIICYTRKKIKERTETEKAVFEKVYLFNAIVNH